MHTSHLGNSPSEVDPTFALQNATNYYPNEGTPASSQIDNAGIQVPGTIGPDALGNLVFTPGDPNPPTPPTPYYGTGVSVNVTQLRNILTGMRPPLSRFVDPSLLAPLYGDANWVLVNGQRWYMPNNTPDIADEPAPGSTIINLPPTTVAGRWGEPGGITPFFDTSVNPLLAFLNPVRAGKSILATGVQYSLNDGRDDNFNATDFWPQPMYAEAGGVSSPIAQNGATLTWPADYYDAAGDLAMPAERARRFATPVDAAGDGELVNWTTRANTGADPFGRVAYRRYFRPGGRPRRDL